MKGLLFSRVMRTDTYFMSRSRAPPPLPPASVFQTVVLLLLNLFVSLLEPPVKTPLIVFVLFASLFILLSLPCWLFPLYSFCPSFCSQFVMVLYWHFSLAPNRMKQIYSFKSNLSPIHFDLFWLQWAQCEAYSVCDRSISPALEKGSRLLQCHFIQL